MSLYDGVHHKSDIGVQLPHKPFDSQLSAVPPHLAKDVSMGLHTDAETDSGYSEFETFSYRFFPDKDTESLQNVLSNIEAFNIPLSDLKNSSASLNESDIKTIAAEIRHLIPKSIAEDRSDKEIVEAFIQLLLDGDTEESFSAYLSKSPRQIRFVRSTSLPECPEDDGVTDPRRITGMPRGVHDEVATFYHENPMTVTETPFTKLINNADFKAFISGERSLSDLKSLDPTQKAVLLEHMKNHFETIGLKEPFNQLLVSTKQLGITAEDLLTSWMLKLRFNDPLALSDEQWLAHTIRGMDIIMGTDHMARATGFHCETRAGSTLQFNKPGDTPKTPDDGLALMWAQQLIQGENPVHSGIGFNKLPKEKVFDLMERLKAAGFEERWSTHATGNDIGPGVGLDLHESLRASSPYAQRGNILIVPAAAHPGDRLFALEARDSFASYSGNEALSSTEKKVLLDLYNRFHPDTTPPLTESEPGALKDLLSKNKAELKALVKQNKKDLLDIFKAMDCDIEFGMKFEKFGTQTSFHKREHMKARTMAVVAPVVLLGAVPGVVIGGIVGGIRAGASYLWNRFAKKMPPKEAKKEAKSALVQTVIAATGIIGSIAAAPLLPFVALAAKLGQKVDRKTHGITKKQLKGTPSELAQSIKLKARREDKDKKVRKTRDHMSSFGKAGHSNIIKLGLMLKDPPLEEGSKLRWKSPKNPFEPVLNYKGRNVDAGAVYYFGLHQLKKQGFNEELTKQALATHCGFESPPSMETLQAAITTAEANVNEHPSEDATNKLFALRFLHLHMDMERVQPGLKPGESVNGAEVKRDLRPRVTLAWHESGQADA